MLNRRLRRFSFSTELGTDPDHNGGFTRVYAQTVGHAPPSSTVTADFNADGKADFAVVDGNSVEVLAGDGQGGFTRNAMVELPLGAFGLAVGDVNGDGTPDIVAANPVSSSVSVLSGDEHGQFALVDDLGTFGEYAVALADVNDDGAVDVIGTSGIRAGILFNQLRDRTDVNGSNRIDGFDVAALERLAGAQRCPPDNLGCGSAYQRNEDVNLDGIIDGEDLALVAHRFGRLRRAVSPLHGTVGTSAAPSPGTVTLQQTASEADLLSLQVLVSNATDAAAGASFAVTFDPTDGTPGQVFEVAGFNPGTFLSGATGQAIDVDARTPGTAKVTVTRLPNTDQTAPGAQPLLILFLRARRTGQAKLDFAPLAYSQPALVNASGQQVPVTFVGGNAVTVDASGGGPPGQQVGFSPDVMNFGSVDLGSSTRKTLRISNFGYSDLDVSNLTSTLPEFSSFFTSPFTVPPYGYVEMPVLFTPARRGWFSGDLIIASNDATHPETHVPVEGESSASLAVVPDRLIFGSVAVGSTRVLTLKLTNRGTTTLTLTDFRSSDGQFVPQSGSTTLDPGQTGQVTVRFAPAASAVVRATLTLSFDAPDATTVVVGMVGAGI